MQLRVPSPLVTLINLKAQVNIIVAPTSAIKCWPSKPVAQWLVCAISYATACRAV